MTCADVTAAVTSLLGALIVIGIAVAFVGLSRLVGFFTTPPREEPTRYPRERVGIDQADWDWPAFREFEITDTRQRGSK